MGNRQSPLHDFHLAHGASMAAFAGWDLPLHYPSGIKTEHLATRTTCGLFDVSHMAQIELTGSGADALLERLTPTDLGMLTDGRVRYSMFLSETGGILDDLMITRLDGALQLVVNAARTKHDITHLKAHLGHDTVMTVHHDKALLALQGPGAAVVLSGFGLELSDLRFMAARRCELLGAACIITRSGYTGEDGFEISIPADRAVTIASALAACDDVTVAGLGARDTLRMEAGLPLWGHELDQHINPVEAGVAFVLSKRRREAADFPGATAIMADFKHRPSRLLTGLRPESRRPVRAGATLFQGQRPVGQITSGGFAPSLNAPAAMGFVETELASAGTQLLADTRGQLTPVQVTALPLTPHRYYRG